MTDQTPSPEARQAAENELGEASEGWLAPRQHPTGFHVQTLLDATTAPLHATIAELRRDGEEKQKAIEALSRLCGVVKDQLAASQQANAAKDALITRLADEWEQSADWTGVEDGVGPRNIRDCAKEIRDCAKEIRAALSPAPSEWVRREELEEAKKWIATLTNSRDKAEASEMALRNERDSLRTALRECREALTDAKDTIWAIRPMSDDGLARNDREGAERMYHRLDALLTSTQHLDQP